MNNHWKHIRNYKDGNTNPALDDYEYDENDFRVKDFEKVFCEETERSSMVKDRNKGITSITYNYLNLPEQIEFENSNSIEYVYNATGVKLKKTVIEETATPEVRKEVDYLDGFQYAGEVLNFFPTAEGYVRATPVGNIAPGSPPTGYAYSYVYNYTDHLGNVRLSYSMDHLTGKLKILEENHYYPFGLRHGVYDTGGKKDFSRNPGDGIEPEPGLPPVLDYVTRMEYQYKYNGKEWQDELGLNIYDYEARNYMPDIGRTTTQDPLTENFANQSSYSFFNNNPIIYIDPDGREAIVVTGGEYDGNRYKYNFVEPAITRLKQLKEAGGDEPITWAVMTAGYSDDDIAKFQSIASDLGVGFQSIGSADEFTNYLNSKDIGASDLSEARQGDQITSMSVFGHGFAGSAEFAYKQDNQASFSWSTDNVKQLNTGAFNNATIDLYTCNSATNTANGTSLANDLSARTGSTVTGYRGQSTYSKMNEGQGMGAKWNRYRNGFNTNGSIKLPQAGEGATRIRYVPPKKK